LTTGRRVHERYDLSVTVKVRHDGGEVTCQSLNISLGGMYLLSETQLAYGTKVVLSFFLAALKEDAKIDGVVRWEKPDGMGVQFGSLRARDVWALNQLFKESTPSTDD